MKPGVVATPSPADGIVEIFKKRHPDLLKHIAPADSTFKGYADRRLLSVCNKEKIERILAYMLDENEFFGPYGIRSLSRYHLEHPFVFNLEWAGVQSPIFARGVEQRDVRRQFQLARAGLDAGERLIDPGLAESLPVLRR